MDVLVVAPAIHPPFVPLFVVPNNVVFFLGAVFGGVHPLVPYEVAVEPVIGLDLAEHNVAGEDFRLAWHDGPQEANIAGKDEGFQRSAVASVKWLAGSACHFVPLPGQEPP